MVREVQETSLSLRMVPLQGTFQKMQRLVRDLSRKSGKPVTFTTDLPDGEDTELDRSIADAIAEPPEDDRAEWPHGETSAKGREARE